MLPQSHSRNVRLGQVEIKDSAPLPPQHCSFFFPLPLLKARVRPAEVYSVLTGTGMTGITANPEGQVLRGWKESSSCVLLAGHFQAAR